MLRAGIVGLGRWGKLLVDAVHGKSDKICIVAGVTRTIANAEQFAREKGFPLTADYERLLADASVDAVVLATPHTLHVEQVKRAAAKGKHVFVDKPFALDQESAQDAARACAAAHRVLAVGFNRRFLPAMQELQRLAGADELGAILHLEGQFSGPTPPWRKPDSWRNSRVEVPAGGMTAKGIHIADAMLSLAGLIQSVYAQSGRRCLTDTDDVTSMLLRFAGGATGYLGTCLSTPDFWRLHVFGSRAWAEIRGERTFTLCRLNGTPETREYPPIDIERSALETFADAVAGISPYPVTIEQAVCGAALLPAIVKSAETGKEVQLTPRYRSGIDGGLETSNSSPP